MKNPVAWQLWDAATLELAKQHNRMLFVSIGYAACHCKLLGSCSLRSFVLTKAQGAMLWKGSLLNRMRLQTY